MNLFGDSKNVVITIIYISMFLDNILLTVVVPIIPDYLISTEALTNNSNSKTSNFSGGFKTPLQLEAELMENENGPVGMLLSSKAVIQLLMNPIVGYLTGICGYNIPMFFGTVNLLVAALLFAFGESYMSLLLARSLQGIASACIAVAGLCVAARLDTDEDARARTLGLILGSVALGVLAGYPLGGFLYDFVGKSTPFLIIAVFIVADIGLQVFYLDLKPNAEAQCQAAPTKWSVLLSDPLIVLSAGAIWVSTTALAVLEPCLPIWLMENLNPEKWQLGTVFIPDSLGYLIGTNFFGVIAYRVGRWKISIAAMLMIGISTLIVPSASNVTQLFLPHFGLGLGIGIIDAALVPLLALLVDTRHQAHYGTVYALQQIAVSLAYSVGPMMGGELVKTIGFPWLMRSIGIINIIYCPSLALLNYGDCNGKTANKSIAASLKNTFHYNSTSHAHEKPSNKDPSTDYKRFHNSDDE